MNAQPHIVLASASPRRKELLAGLGLHFAVCVSGVEEKPWPGETPASYSLRNASDKARAVELLRPGALVIAADTIVVLKGRILGKPKDEENAKAILASKKRTAEVPTAAPQGLFLWKVFY